MGRSNRLMEFIRGMPRAAAGPGRPGLEAAVARPGSAHRVSFARSALWQLDDKFDISL